MISSRRSRAVTGALTFLSVNSLAGTASAQEVAASNELPPVVIEGATLDKPKVVVRRAPAAIASVPGPPVQGASKSTAEAQGSSPDSAGSAAQPGESPSANAFGNSEVSGVPSKEVSAAVTVVTGDQIRAQQIRQAADALRSLPGVDVSQSGSGAGLTQVRIRGAEGNHTLVLIDGVDASDPTGNEFDFSNLLADDIDRIEVIRGGQSGIYGSKAIGGVINIITRSGRGPLAVSARSEIGGYGTKDVAVRASGGTDRAWLSVAGTYKEQTAFNWDRFGTEDDPWHNKAINVKGGFSPFDGLSVDFVIRDSQKYVASDGDAYFPLPQTGHNGALDSAAYTDVNVFLGGVNVRWDLDGGAWTHVVKANHTRTDSDNFSYGSIANNLGEATTYSYLLTHRFTALDFLNSTHSISAMVDSKQEEFTPTAFYTDGLRRERNYVATVGEYRGGFYDRVFINGAIRHDDNDKFDDFTTWHSGISIALPEFSIRPHAQVGTSVALPGMFEQFGTVLGSFIGNPNLVPEESFGWDTGVEFTLLRGRATLDVTYFEQDLTNKIASGPGYPANPTLINLAGVSHRQGVEIGGRLLVLDGLTLGASYTFLDATDPSGQEEVRRPRNTARFDANYLFDQNRGNVNLAVVYNGDQKDLDFAFFNPTPHVTLDGYCLVNLAASYKLTDTLEIFGRVDNLLNERYEEILGYNTLGAAAFAGVKITFEDPSTAAWAKYR